MDFSKDFLRAQKNEITEYYIYTKLSRAVRDEKNSRVLKEIGVDEKRHYDFWKDHTGVDVSPSKLRISFFYWVSRILGITFGIKLMEKGEDALKSSVYTGIAYIVTVFILILPYLTFSHYFTALLFTLAAAVMIIFVFNYYISVAKDLSFKKRFLEMFIISMGVAVFSFGIGWLIRIFLGVEI